MAIYQEVLDFIARPDPTNFGPLALKIFRFQYESVAPYRAFCDMLRVIPDNARTVDEVPAVSTLAFKFARLTSAPALDSDARTFLTSGTTIGRDERGRHVVPKLELYRASALAHLRRMMFPDRRAIAMLALR